MTLNRTIQIAELCFHVDGASTTYGAFVGGFEVLVVAALMDAVTTRHEDHRHWGIKHVFPTNWAIAVRDTLDTLMGLFDGHLHTHTTCLTRY